ncbi:MAG: hypothetical protein JJ902_05630 [Roseibium sp.]|nr:hypothetical protein [Roseibium sp.]
MTDPRKPIHHPDEETQKAVRLIVHGHLLDCTDKATKELKCTGASFVIMGLGMWAAELAEIDAKAASQLLASLSNLYNPRTNGGQKRRAEKQRRQAVAALLATADLTMAKSEGSA